MLNPFKSKKNPPTNHIIEFHPEIDLHAIHKTEKQEEMINVRFYSGDNQKINKNIKILANNIQELSLQVTGFDDFNINLNSANTTGSCALRIKRFDSETPEIVTLSDIDITVTQKNHPIPPTMHDQIKKEISEIIQEEFGLALDEFNADTIYPQKNEESTGTPKRITLSGMITGVCLLIIIGCIITITGNKLDKNNNLKETIYEAAASAATQESQNDSLSAEDEALQEFGLEKGIDLSAH